MKRLNKKPHLDPGIKSTRFHGLGYAYFGPGVWRFIDLTQPSLGGWATVGMIYPLQSELLADIDRYAKEYGFEA